VSRLLRWGLASIVLVVAGAWLAVGLLPRLDDAGMEAADEESVDEESEWTDEPTASRVTDPSDGTYDGIRTYTNRGIAPITVRLGENPGSAYYYFAGSLHELDTQTYVPGEARDAITVGPGGSFSVEFALGLGCTHHDGGSTVGLDSIELEVTTLGLTRSVDVPLGRTVLVGFSADFEPVEGCMDTGRPEQPGFPVGW